MNVQDYLKEINKESQSIFQETIKDMSSLGKVHYFSTCIFDFSENITDIHEKKVLATVSAQLELSTVTVTFGLYRSALSSLRLALEMALGVIYFSAHKLEFQEWIDGGADIKWATIIDENNGVLSKRFAKAFFKELSDSTVEYREKAVRVYRKLSEFVHGNKETWNKSGINVQYNYDLLNFYLTSLDVVFEVILFSLSCRYLKHIPRENLESLEFVRDELNHIAQINSVFS